MDKVWLESYQEGVPSEIKNDQYSSLVDLFDESCETFKHNIAFINRGTGIRYSELNQSSRDFAAYLHSLGLKKGERVAIMLPNLLQYPVAIFGILRAGLVVVNTNPLYTADEVAHQVNDSGAKAILVLANFAHTVEKALPRMPGLQHIIISKIGDMFPPIKRSLINFVVQYIKKIVPAYKLPQSISFLDALKIGKSKNYHKPRIAQKDLAFLQYTGGTTGVSKGAMLSHGNMLANLLQASAWIEPLNINEHEVVITAIPLYHIFSLTANCLTFLKTGAKNILITNPRDIGKFIDEIKNTGVTVITGVNTLFNTMLNHPKFSEIDFSKLKLALAGGMALQKSVAIRWREKTKHPVLEAYGLTETCPAVTMNPLNLTDYNSSVGLPLPSTEISIRNDEGKELPIGEAGELCIKGPQVMQGYWNRQDETDMVFWPDGYLRSGDIATVDYRGYVYLVDRKKDMILVSGFNVYPNEIEQVISMHPGVQEVGVIGILDPESGEKVKACVVRKDPDLTETEIIAHCREHLTAYKVPKVIQFFDELPKSEVGKILRRSLR